MTDVIILGGGAMGHVLADAINETDDMDLLGIVDPLEGDTLDRIPGHRDAVIDFSHPANLDMLISHCTGAGCGAVIATTGFSPEQESAIAQLGKTVPVVFSANFSLGVTVMKKVLGEIAPVLSGDFDMEVVEMHHNKKLDSPSGTAKMLVRAMDPDDRFEKVYGRSGNGKRGNEIGIHALRGGTVAGEHRVIFAGEDEIIEIRHLASSKKIFAAGALKAARFISTAPPGLYTMDDVLFG